MSISTDPGQYPSKLGKEGVERRFKSDVEQEPIVQLKSLQHFLILIPLFQLISTLALVAVASAQYAPAPVVKVVKEIPQPYAYEYGVADDYSKANFRKTETQDAAGNVGGSFTIALPDGRIQTTTYTADHTNGFVAEVTYSGEAVYPPAPAGGYPGEAHAAPAPGYAPGRK